MRGYDIIHGVVNAMTGSAPVIRDKTQVRVLTEEGEIFEVASVEYEAEGNVVWLKVEISE